MKNKRRKPCTVLQRRMKNLRRKETERQCRVLGGKCSRCRSDCTQASSDIFREQIVEWIILNTSWFLNGEGQTFRDLGVEWLELKIRNG